MDLILGSINLILLSHHSSNRDIFSFYFIFIRSTKNIKQYVLQQNFLIISITILLIKLLILL